MLKTSGTIKTAIDYYRSQVKGVAKGFIALRVDRGLSAEHVLKSPLGLYWDQEKGLNNKQYIIPGAGGLGE
ncbi:MAG: hypothetical protein V4654_10520 [Bdellovibrionota bacterium]